MQPKKGDMKATVLVLKRFTLGQSQPGGPLLDAQGRAPGLLAFVLTAMGLDPTTTFLCYPDRIEIVEAGMSGRQSLVLPLNKVTGIVGGHSMPLAPLALAGFGFLLAVPSVLALVLSLGDAATAIVAAIMGVFFVVVGLLAYFLGRSMTLAVQNGGDSLHGIRFGQGIIEGVAVNPQRVQQAVEMLNRAVAAAARG